MLLSKINDNQVSITIYLLDFSPVLNTFLLAGCLFKNLGIYSFERHVFNTSKQKHTHHCTQPGP